MQLAARPYLTAGVALAGASVIAASSVTPLPDIHLPDIHLPAISTANVHLTTLENPLEAYAQVLQNLFANVGTLASTARPGQVLQQILANQLGGATGLGAALQTTGGDLAQALTTLPALVQTAVGQLAAGNIAGAVSTVLTAPVAVAFPLTNLLPALATALTTPVQNLVNVVNAFLAPGNLLSTELDVAGLIAPLISTPAAVALAAQNVIGAITTANPAGVVGALLTAPATIADGILNGGIGPDLGPLVAPTLGIPVFAGGLFSPSAFVNGVNGFFVNTGGPIYALEQVLNTIAGALAPPAATAVKPVQADPASIPATTAAATITLKTGSSAVSIPTKAIPSAADTATDPVKDPAGAATSATASTTGATTGSTESASTTKDSTTKSDPTDATGTKVDPPKHTTGDSPKSGDATGTTKTAASDSGSEKGAGKGGDKGAGKGSEKSSHDGGGKNSEKGSEKGGDNASKKAHSSK